MVSFLIFLHVVSAIILLGPVMVATSIFPRQADEARAGDQRAAGRAQLLGRISSTYGVISALVPLLGATVLFAGWAQFKTQGQFHASLVLAVIAWAILIALVIPQQKKMLGTLNLLPVDDVDPEHDQVKDWDKSKKMATIGAGIFNLLWVIMLILMFI
ncbi:DUF2269 domain-containing protein [Corynebacterium breve]|uniref:DUF2269 domain-containing protein n=1 Tax=Corynebacterium breve TaxID=3049799 RepID=A0ABY8VK42_9CORY|nr:DUF2269 domain-containing protein [Corynebacterium breve]WIM68598.1 DUF2269 domain-containing protein [Corynebacterium breve]